MTRSATLFPVLIALLACGCAGDPWEAYDSSLYSTLREPSPETYAAHLALLLRLVEEREAQGKVPPPGICAESAFYLHRVGRSSEASAYLARETRHYPESGPVVSALGRLIDGKSALRTEGARPQEKTP